MKTLLVDAHCFDYYSQGIVSYLEGIYKELLIDNDIQIIFFAKNIEKIKKVFGDKAKYVSLKYSNPFLRLLFEYPLLLRNYKNAYAHFQYIIPFIKNRNIKYINTIHDLIPLDFPQFYSLLYRIKVKYLFRLSAKKTDFLLTVSNYSKESLVRNFAISADKIYITNNAVKNIFTNHNKNNSEKESFILNVSRFEDRKNQLQLLKAFTELKLYDAYELIFIGGNINSDTIFNSYLNNLTDDIRKKIRILNNINDNSLSDFYARTSLFVYPSIAEGFGIPPLEAALCGAKVLCSNSTALSDFDFFTLFDPNILDDLKTKLLIMLQQKDYPFDEIINVIKQRYTWKTSAKTIKKIINSYG